MAPSRGTYLRSKPDVFITAQTTYTYLRISYN